ncbi:MAG TPA: hypothetical protein P5055_18120, partial [Candidatus Paceibacterota bacterium]|nr:hypothetical protein [Candidatus Paceibacterota bacterium]
KSRDLTAHGRTSAPIKEGAIKDFAAGERWSVFEPVALSLLETVLELRGDPDLNATNEGVILLWIR